MLRRHFLFAVAACFVCATGCAAIRQNFAREAALERELDAYVIPKPLPEVWGGVTSVSGPHDTLLWQGVSFTWEDDGPWKKRTSRRTDKSKSLGDEQVEVTWFECEGRPARGGAQVRYSKVVERTTYRNGQSLGTEKRSERRTDLELELIREFDPAAADRIVAKGEAAARAER